MEEEESLAQNEAHRSGVDAAEARPSGSRQQKHNSARTGQTTRIEQLSQKQSAQLERISRSVEKQVQLSLQLKSSVDKIGQKLDRIDRTNSMVADWVNRKKVKKEQKKKKKNRKG